MSKMAPWVFHKVKRYRCRYVHENNNIEVNTGWKRTSAYCMMSRNVYDDCYWTILDNWDWKNWTLYSLKTDRRTLIIKIWLLPVKPLFGNKKVMKKSGQTFFFEEVGFLIGGNRTTPGEGYGGGCGCLIFFYRFLLQKRSTKSHISFIILYKTKEQFLSKSKCNNTFLYCLLPKLVGIL